MNMKEFEVHLTTANGITEVTLTAVKASDRTEAGVVARRTLCDIADHGDMSMFKVIRVTLTRSDPDMWKARPRVAINDTHVNITASPTGSDHSLRISQPVATVGRALEYEVHFVDRIEKNHRKFTGEMVESFKNLEADFERVLSGVQV